MPHLPRGLSLLLGLLLLSGCGGGAAGDHAVVTGRIVQDGQPLKVRGADIGTGVVEVRLIPQFEGAEVETAHASADGSFKFEGAGNGIKPGKYKIAVLALETPDDPTASPTGQVDLLKGAFGPEKTPIEREITAGNFDLGTIDLSKVGG